jgi:hypothetical protein
MLPRIQEELGTRETEEYDILFQKKLGEFLKNNVKNNTAKIKDTLMKDSNKNLQEIIDVSEKNIFLRVLQDTTSQEWIEANIYDKNFELETMLTITDKQEDTECQFIVEKGTYSALENLVTDFDAVEEAVHASLSTAV